MVENLQIIMINKTTPQPSLFSSLTDQLNPRHPLYLLANKIDWRRFEEAFSPLYCAVNGRLAKPILQLLESSDVLKIGADVAGDLRSLRQIRHFRDGGFVDLQGIAPEWGIGEKSLRKLSAIVLGRRVSKAQRLSNWEAATLTDKQQLYAATDAWVCTRIYEQLLRTPKKPIRK